ncbi:tetratricopeptide repeat protein [Candidatus Fermentibacteria bacterium]|nr:tetratricopeptide repeat protein [Candidatus Fermentibacteria bacterium]
MVRSCLLVMLAMAVVLPVAAQEDEDVSILLERARQERRNLEEQIAREEQRLTRIEAELVQLRRQRAIMASAQSAFELGEQLYTSGSIVWARDAFKSVVESFPDSRYYDRSLFRLELIEFQLQSFDQALEYGTRLREESPGFEHLDLSLIVSALCHHNLGQFERSRQMLDDVSPGSDYAKLGRYLKAVGYVEEGNIDMARQVLIDLIENAGFSKKETDLADRARIALAQLLVEEEGRYEEALEYYDKISPFSSYYDVAMLGKVWTLMRQESYQDAYNLAERVLEEVPGSDLRSEFELAMANCALGAEDLDIAIHKYERLLRENLSGEDYYDILLSGGSSPNEQYEAERERLERIRLGLAELKEEAYTQGDLELVELIEEEEAQLRQLFVEMSNLESELAMPVDIDQESLRRELNVLISRSRESTKALAVSVDEVERIAESRGSSQDLQRLQRLEEEVNRIHLALQDLASQFESGLTQEHDWVQETNYGIAIAKYMERELKRDSLAYLGRMYAQRIDEAYTQKDTTMAEILIQQRQEESRALQARIQQAALESATYFEEYMASFPDSRFIPDVLVRLAQLYYDIDKANYLDRLDQAEGYVPEDYSRSVELYQRVLTNYPGSEVEDVALYSLGYCLSVMGDPTEAVSKYKTLLERWPNSELAPETYIRTGDYYFDSFEFDSARAYYRHVLDYPGMDPDHFQLGVYKLAWTEYMLNNYLKSAATFGYLIKDSQLMDSLGVSRRGGAMVDEAVEYIAHDFMEQKKGPPVSMATSFLDDFGDREVSFEVLKHMADFYREQGYWSDAIDSYEALLNRHPNHQRAPFFQARIAVCYEGMGDHEQAAVAREALVDEYGEQSEWAQEVGEEASMAAIDSLRGSSLEQAIAFYHNQAVEMAKESPAQARPYYESLTDRIEIYLQEYGDSRSTYDFRFLLGDAYYALGNYVEAGDTYMAVARDSISSQRREDAANNAWSSYFIAYDEQPGIDSAEVRQKQIEATNFYVESFPQGENAPQFLFGVAGNLYNAKKYNQARELYTTVYNQYPNCDYAARSARFIAAAYEAEEMYSDAEEWYSRASETAARTGEDLGEDVELLAATAAYRDASSLAESEDTSSLIAAAQRYEESARNHPESEIAPNALYDAGETFGKAGAIEDAIRVFRDLAQLYPESELAPKGMLRAAYMARELGRNEMAGDTYLEAYSMFPNYQDMGRALYSAAVAYEEAERMDLAVNVYDRIISERTGSADMMVHVYGRYGKHLYDMGSFSRARNMFQDCIEVYDQHRSGDPFFPAQSAFYLGEMAYEDYDALEVTTETAQRKTQLMQEAERWYGKALEYRNDVYFMAACVRAGELYEDFANAIAFMDPPAEIADDPNAVDEFYNSLYSRFYEPKMQQAQQVYRTALEKAVSSGIDNEWVEKAAEHLDLIAPGMPAEIGYVSETEEAAPTTGEPTEGAPEEGEETEEGFEAAEEPETEQPPSEEEEEEPEQVGEEVEEQPSEYEEEEGEGGGCFLWPF